MKTFIYTICLLALQQICLAQEKFDDAYFRLFTATYVKSPVEVLKADALPSFSFIAGNGNVYSLEQVFGVYEAMKEEDREILELKVNQHGTSAIASGVLRHVMNEKASQAKHIYKVRFTYVFVHSDDKWKLASAQHTDFSPNRTEDEMAIKKVIEEETASFFKAEPAINKGYFLHVPYMSRLYGEGLFVGKTLEEGTKKYWETHKPSDTKTTVSEWNLTINGNSAYATYLQKKETSGETSNSFEERYLERVNEAWKIVGITSIDNPQKSK